MKKRLFPALLTAAIPFLLWGCYYDVEEELYPTVIDCDTNAVSYASAVTPILSSKCLSCHGGDAALGGSYQLGTYADLKAYLDVSKANFISSIKQDGAVSAMPKGLPKLPDCEINKLVSWINKGYPEN